MDLIAVRNSIPIGWLGLVARCQHFCVRLERLLFRRSPLYWVEKHTAAGINAQALKRPDGGPKICHFCGFAMARFYFSNQWGVETCSARLTKPGNSKLMRWAEKLSQGADQAVDAQPSLDSRLPANCQAGIDVQKDESNVAAQAVLQSQSSCMDTALTK